MKLEDDAIILNGINQVDHPSIPFMSGPFTEDGEQVEWDSISNVTIDGGILDMNGKLNAERKKPQNIPLINSSGGFALGYCSNITIKNMTMKNAFNGHAIQLANVTNATIENCSFEGQSIPADAKDSGIITKELIQIEPGTRKGFPYSANENKKATSRVAIKDCYFGKSDECGEPVTFIGTHSQPADTEKCNNISITGNTFDNPYYCGIRFCGYDKVGISNNTFVSKKAGDSVQKRDDGRVMINAFCYNDKTKEPVVPNSNISIVNNTMNIADNGCRGIRIARDDNAQGIPTGFQIIKNEISAEFSNNESGIHANRVEDALIKENKVTGFKTGILLDKVSEDINVYDNCVWGSGDNNMNMRDCGAKNGFAGNINVKTSGNGILDINTIGDSFSINAKAFRSSHFVQWSNGVVEPEISVMKGDTLTLTAQYE